MRNRPTRKSARPAPARPQVESLEDRYVPSAAMLSAVQDVFGNSLLFYIDSTGALNEDLNPLASAGSAVRLSAGPYSELSAGLTADGQADVVVVDPTGAVWFDVASANANANLTLLNASGFKSAVADLQGNVLGVDTAGGLWLNQPQGGVYGNNWSPQAAADFTQVAAGDSPGGTPAFYALDTAGNIWLDTPTTGGAPVLTQLTFGGGFTTISADRRGDVYGLDTHGVAWLQQGGNAGSFTPQGTGPFVSISAGVSGTGAAATPLLYLVDSAGALWQDLPGAQGQPSFAMIDSADAMRSVVAAANASATAYSLDPNGVTYRTTAVGASMATLTQIGQPVPVSQVGLAANNLVVLSNGGLYARVSNGLRPLATGPFTQFAVAPVAGTPAAVMTVAVDTTGNIYFNANSLSVSGFYAISTSGGFKSVVMDSAGNILALDKAGFVWLNTPISAGQYTPFWVLQTAGRFTQIASSGNNMGGGTLSFFTLDAAGNIYQDTPNASTGAPSFAKLTTAGGFTQISADNIGDIYGLDSAGHVWLKLARASTFMQQGNTSFTKIGAGLVPSGASVAPVLYAVDTAGNLWQDLPSPGTQPSFTELSVGGFAAPAADVLANNAVYALEANGSVATNSTQGVFTTLL